MGTLQKATVTLLVLLFIGGLSFYLLKGPEGRPSKDKYSTNMTGLYASFTPAFKEKVDQTFKVMDCQPSRYLRKAESERKRNICFRCGNFDVCFGYGRVQRPSGEKINQDSYATVFLKGEYNTVDSLNVNSYGLTEALDCKANGKCEDGISARLETIDIPGEMFESRSKNVVLKFPEGVNVKEKMKEAAPKAGLSECELEDNVFECSPLLGSYKPERNEVVI